MKSLEKLGRLAENNRQDAVDKQNKLKADLKAMQQSTAATYKLESQQVCVCVCIQ